MKAVHSVKVKGFVVGEPADDLQACRAVLLSITNCCALLTCVTGPWGFARGLVRLYLETPSTAPCAAILVCLKQEEFSFASAAAPAKPSGKCAQLLSAVLTLSSCLCF